MKDPLLTIMMPSYNYGRFLRQAIESILIQEFSDYEFLIIDDGSSDESVEIIREYMQQDRRIQARFYPKNGGMLQRVNEGTEWARGKYIHYLAADDFRYPGFLDQCMKVLNKHPHLGMCATQFHWGNDEKLQLETCGSADEAGVKFFDPSQMVEAFLHKNFKIFALATLIQTALIKKYGGFDPLLYYYSDWYLLNEIAFNHPLALILEPLSRFRIHDSNFSNLYRHNKKTKRAAYQRMFEKLHIKKNHFYKEQVRKSALLSPVFQDLFWKLLFNPKYLSYWPYINLKYPIKNRILRSLNKRLHRVDQKTL